MPAQNREHPALAPVPREGLVIGFDADLTLFDNTEGIVESARQVGVTKLDDLRSRMGLRIQEEFALHFPPAEIDHKVASFRRHMRRQMRTKEGCDRLQMLPGADVALGHVWEIGGCSVVLTGKEGHLASMALDHLGLEVDSIIGELTPEDKARELHRLGAWGYVGDQEGDMRAARNAEIIAIGVTTGTYGEHAYNRLTQAGAHVVLDSLLEFPYLLDANR